MYQLADHIYGSALEALAKEDADRIAIIYADEQRLDDMELSLRQDHMKRLTEGHCSAEAGVLFLDVISNLERVGDHATNIAEVAEGKIQ